MTRASPSPTQAVVAGLLVLVSVMGIGRFAYTPLQPIASCIRGRSGV